MDYKLTVGEDVLRYDGEKGKVTEVDEQGCVHIRYEGDYFAAGYLYDPFINGDAKFVKTELQAQIDVAISNIENSLIALRDNNIAASEAEETFYVTKANEDGSREVICRLKCDIDIARRIFVFFVKEQQKEYRGAHGAIKWHQLRLYDSATGKIMAQES